MLSYKKEFGSCATKGVESEIGMISELIFKNFKGFCDEERVPIAPMTMMFGANSAGKSSVMQVLSTVLIPQSRQPYMGFSKPPFDFFNCVHGHDLDQKITVGLTIVPDETHEIKQYVGTGMKPHVTYLFTYKYAGGGGGVLTEIVIRTAVIPDESAIPSEGPPPEDRVIKICDISGKTPTNSQTLVPDNQPVNALLDVQGWHPNQTLATMYEKLDATWRSTNNMQNFIDGLGTKYHGAAWDIVNTTTDNLLAYTVKGKHPERSVDVASYLESELAAYAALLDRSLNGDAIVTIAADRRDRDDNKGGKDAVSLFEKEAKTYERMWKHRDELNTALESMGVNYAVMAKDALHNIPAGTANLLFVRELDSDIPVGMKYHIGHGIKELIAILTEIIGAESQLFLIEEPAAHLHPRLAAELAEWLLKYALKSGKCFFVETHSEHMVLRLKRLVRSQKIRKNDAAILALTKDEQGAYILHIRMNERGEFVNPWPGGFFPERKTELLG